MMRTYDDELGTYEVEGRVRRPVQALKASQRYCNIGPQRDVAKANQ